MMFDHKYIPVTRMKMSQMKEEITWKTALYNKISLKKPINLINKRKSKSEEDKTKLLKY